MSAFLPQKSCFCIITTAGYGVIGIHLLGPFFFSVSFGLLAVHLESGPVSRPIQSMCFSFDVTGEKETQIRYDTSIAVKHIGSLYNSLDIVECVHYCLVFFLFRTSASLERQFTPEATTHYPEVPLTRLLHL